MHTTSRRRWMPPLVWAAAIFWLSSQSRPLGRHWPALPSALAHVFEFAVLAALLRRALVTDRRPRRGTAALAFLLTALYAATDEVHQLFVPEREARPSEYGLDLLGASLGVAIAGARAARASGRLSDGEGKEPDVAEEAVLLSDDALSLDELQHGQKGDHHLQP